MIDTNLQLQQYNYDLPSELIAQTPLSRRDQARLLVVERKTGKISHDKFVNLPKYLPKKSVVVLNDSKVIPARLFGKKTRSGGAVEIFLLKALGRGEYETLLRPMRKIKDGDEVVIDGTDLKAQIIDRRKKIVRFIGKNIRRQLHTAGHMPLPPYIKREDDQSDRKLYQTVYATKPGSVASPTAGLHFTRGLLLRLKRHGHQILKATLHVSYATFKPVEEEDISRHPMHAETYELTAGVFKKINQAREKGEKIVAVGTTSCRVLETVAQNKNLSGETRLFIYPGYSYRLVDILITNFHLPQSTLLMLVYAFGGTELMRRAYQEAIEKRYRFYSYGDAMIII